jgi:AcrR family transcriptional regulator
MAKVVDIGPRPGRPRDPDVERRVFDAAAAVYAQYGWARFSYDAVAKQSGVGKPALYRRWPSKQDLLLAMLDDRQRVIHPKDTGSLRGDLIELASDMLTGFLEEHGLMSLRLYIDARTEPDLAETAKSSILGGYIIECRNIVRRAVKRDELSPNQNLPVLLLDLVTGAVITHALVTPPEMYEKVAADMPRYVATLVDVVLLGASALESLPDAAAGR